MDEDIERTGSPSYEAEAPSSVEPLHPRGYELVLGNHPEQRGADHAATTLLHVNHHLHSVVEPGELYTSVLDDGLMYDRILLTERYEAVVSPPAEPFHCS